MLITPTAISLETSRCDFWIDPAVSAVQALSRLCLEDKIMGVRAISKGVTVFLIKKMEKKCRKGS